MDDLVLSFMAPAEFGLMGMDTGIGGTISPAISGPIADAAGTPRWSFAMAAGNALVGAGLGFTLHIITRARGQEAAGRSTSPACP